MIIQCDHCSAKFRIDDAKLANGAVKVRCAKCKEIFVVKSEAPPAESLQAPVSVQPPTATAGFEIDSSGADNDFSFDQEQSSGSSAPDIPSPAADEFDWKDASVNIDTQGSSSEFDGSTFGTDSAPAQAFVAPATSAAADNDFDFGDINMQSSPAEGTLPLPPQDDFSIDFGEISFATPPLPSAADEGGFPEPSTGDFSFDDSPLADSSPVAGNDDFLLSFNTDESKPSAPPAEVGENVNFGDFSFGDMGDDAKVDQAVVVQKQASPAEKDFAPPPLLAAPDEELVPTSLASRKKSGSRFPLFLIFGAIVIVVALAGAGVYFIGGSKAFSKAGLGFLVDWYGQKNAEEGGITLRNSTSSYVVNSSAGELFVVRGEAVNNFNKPRASVQVKVSILGPGGAVLVSKSAFCGNSLSSEQLASLPLAKIEEAMNNQFGDSLANLGVKPGSAIPFVVVISAVPKEATDYSLQIVGSTIATQ